MATAPIQPLAWEPPYASDAALKKTEKKKKREREREIPVAVSSTYHYLALCLVGKAQVWDSGTPCSRVGFAAACCVALDKLPSLSEPQMTSWAIPSSDSLGF